MAVKHEILKNGNGKTRVVSITPLKAIRLHCVECMGFQPSMIRDCTSPLCPVFPFRFGKTKSGTNPKLLKTP
jgi:hypothetical protein